MAKENIMAYGDIYSDFEGKLKKLGAKIKRVRV